MNVAGGFSSEVLAVLHELRKAEANMSKMTGLRTFRRLGMVFKVLNV